MPYAAVPARLSSERSELAPVAWPMSIIFLIQLSSKKRESCSSMFVEGIEGCATVDFPELEESEIGERGECVVARTW